jgi:hypothetical protein
MTWNFFGHLLVEEKITRMENGIQKTKKLRVWLQTSNGRIARIMYIHLALLVDTFYQGTGYIFMI